MTDRNHLCAANGALLFFLSECINDLLPDGQICKDLIIGCLGFPLFGIPLDADHFRFDHFRRLFITDGCTEQIQLSVQLVMAYFTG